MQNIVKCNLVQPGTGGVGEVALRGAAYIELLILSTRLAASRGVEGLALQYDMFGEFVDERNSSPSVHAFDESCELAVCL